MRVFNFVKYGGRIPGRANVIVGILICNADETSAFPDCICNADEDVGVPRLEIKRPLFLAVGACRIESRHFVLPII